MTPRTDTQYFRLEFIYINTEFSKPGNFRGVHCAPLLNHLTYLGQPNHELNDDMLKLSIYHLLNKGGDSDSQPNAVSSLKVRCNRRSQFNCFFNNQWDKI